MRFFCSILFLQKQTACYLPCTFIDYTWNIFVINLLPMLANYPSSSKLERVYEQSAHENLERTALLLSSHYHSWTWTQASYRQCTHALCYQRNNESYVDCIAPLSSLTFLLKRQERWFWLRGNLLSFPVSIFGSEEFNKFAFAQTQL